MKNVVSIIDGEIRLCSGLGEYAFGKTNYNSIVTQEGLLACCDSQPGQPLHFSFSPWTFKDIKSYDLEGQEERIVFFCAPNPFSDKTETLYQLFAKAGQEDASIEDKDKMYEASFAVCALLTQAAGQGLDIPVNGAGGILADGKNFLLLPHDVFVHSVAGLNNVEQADQHNCWINPSLTGLPAICFARSNYAYKMLTGRFAYPAADSITRNADLLDKKFLPLELCINGINEELAKAVTQYRNRGELYTENFSLWYWLKKNDCLDEFFPNPQRAYTTEEKERIATSCKNRSELRIKHNSIYVWLKENNRLDEFFPK